MHHERAKDEHYSDLLKTIEFLFDSKEETDVYKRQPLYCIAFSKAQAKPGLPGSPIAHRHL